ncbi:hypothetical protein GF345_04855 [Candidatus Woesearchaeota archaeon]|nr:hypothetical protein [Candidatus Woesearchaeota archaeon]
MFENLKYKITGTELRTKNRNEPSSTYIILNLSPHIRDDYSIQEVIEINLNLSSLKKIIRSGEAKEIIDSLADSSTADYKSWIGKAQKLFSYVRSELHDREIKIKF